MIAKYIGMKNAKATFPIASKPSANRRRLLCTTANPAEKQRKPGSRSVDQPPRNTSAAQLATIDFRLGDTRALVDQAARKSSFNVFKQSPELEKARAIYDYVFTTMRYDKSGTGWGHGDTLWACDSKRGNCTDFHSVFMSMARSQHIPARFEIGFPLPADKHSAEIPGYHCRAEFYTGQTGWVPIDISEAWKHQEKRDYFFGAHDNSRVQFTMGRDLTLNPKQSGPALNYFVYPYVEVDGKEYPNVSIDFSFRDADTTPATTSAANTQSATEQHP
jgi:hypothetical protein